MVQTWNRNTLTHSLVSFRILKEAVKFLINLLKSIIYLDLTLQIYHTKNFETKTPNFASRSYNDCDSLKGKQTPQLHKSTHNPQIGFSWFNYCHLIIAKKAISVEIKQKKQFKWWKEKKERNVERIKIPRCWFQESRHITQVGLFRRRKIISAKCHRKSALFILHFPFVYSGSNSIKYLLKNGQNFLKEIFKVEQNEKEEKSLSCITIKSKKHSSKVQ